MVNFYDCWSIRAICRWFGPTFAILVSATTVFAEPYRLIHGDTLAVSVTGGEQTDYRVDIDGQIRLANIGAVSVVRLTLDEVEEQIEALILKAGLFVDPQANVAIQAYAPVVVTGDVLSPGRFDFLPNMTIAAALGLSGGSQSAGSSRFDVERLITETEGQLTLLNLTISENIILEQRLKAELAGLDTFKLTAQQRALIPQPDETIISQMIENERQILTNNRSREEELLAFWEEEIETLQNQGDLLQQRIKVQNEIVESVADLLEKARELQERGLQTASSMSRAEQLDADARSRVLELESAISSQTRAIADSRRQRVRFLRSKREEALNALQSGQVALEDARLRYARAREQLANLSGGNMASLIAEDIVTVSFRVIRPRPEQSPITNIGPQSQLLPGDTLIVRVSAVESVN